MFNNYCTNSEIVIEEVIYCFISCLLHLGASLSPFESFGNNRVQILTVRWFTSMAQVISLSGLYFFFPSSLFSFLSSANHLFSALKIYNPFLSIPFILFQKKNLDKSIAYLNFNKCISKIRKKMEISEIPDQTWAIRWFGESFQNWKILTSSVKCENVFLKLFMFRRISKTHKYHWITTYIIILSKVACHP